MHQRSSLIRPRTVTGDGDGLVSHAGVAWLAETADLSGLTSGLSAAMAGVPQRRHDAGRTLAQMVLALADGTTCLTATSPAAAADRRLDSRSTTVTARDEQVHIVAGSPGSVSRSARVGGEPIRAVGTTHSEDQRSARPNEERRRRTRRADVTQ